MRVEIAGDHLVEAVLVLDVEALAVQQPQKVLRGHEVVIGHADVAEVDRDHVQAPLDDLFALEPERPLQHRDGVVPLDVRRDELRDDLLQLRHLQPVRQRQQWDRDLGTDRDFSSIHIFQHL